MSEPDTCLGVGAGNWMTWESIKNKSQLLTYKNHLAFWHIKTNFSPGFSLLNIVLGNCFQYAWKTGIGGIQVCSYWAFGHFSHLLVHWLHHEPGTWSSLEPHSSSRPRSGLKPNSAQQGPYPSSLEERILLLEMIEHLFKLLQRRHLKKKCWSLGKE